MKKPKTTLTLIVIATFFGWCLLLAYTPIGDAPLCRNEYETVHCLANNGFAQFWMHEVSNPSFDEALESIKTNSCKDLSFTADTLTVATKINPLNAHYSEELVEVSDAMIATHPECFLKAVQMTTLETQQKIREAIARINGDWSTSRGIKDLEPHLQKSEFRSLRDLWEKTESETEN